MEVNCKVRLSLSCLETIAVQFQVFLTRRLEGKKLQQIWKKMLGFF